MFTMQLSIESIMFYRPFERTITMHKDSTGHVGFIFKNGKITSIVKDSSAARNGLLTEHNICEINGQNVIGLKVKNMSCSAGFVLTSKIYQYSGRCGICCAGYTQATQRNYLQSPVTRGLWNR